MPEEILGLLPGGELACLTDDRAKGRELVAYDPASHSSKTLLMNVVGTARTLSPKGRILVLEIRGEFKVWDVERQAEVMQFSRPADSVTTIRISPDERTMAVGSRTGSIEFLELPSGAPSKEPAAVE